MVTLRWSRISDGWKSLYQGLTLYIWDTNPEMVYVCDYRNHCTACSDVFEAVRFAQEHY